MTKTNTKKATTSVSTNVSPTVITKDNIGTINPILTFNNKGRLATANSKRASSVNGKTYKDALAIYTNAKALNPNNPKLKPLRALTYDIFKVKSLSVPKGYTLG
jgi:hypothetical protein|tara:strand:+ start:344 stop:655 length:312 start_codon:yes stop_codon:yes gene_type:complete